MSQKITYRERGQGQLLLLLHGYGGSVHHWQTIAETLEGQYRIIVPNLGHLYLSTDKLSFSQQVDALAKFIEEHFPGEKVHVAGLSFGGALAWGLATQHPHLVKTTALINPMVTDPIKHFLPIELRFFFTIPINLKSIYVMLATPMGKSFLKRSAQIFRDERSDGATAVENLQGRKLQFVAYMIHHFAWILRSEDWSAWNKKLLSYRGECRLIYDLEDLLFNEEAYKRFAKHIGCDDVITLTGAGHLAIKSRPELIAQYIRELIEETIAA
ncbi:alpha/beta fold hydrolase [Bdellovibrio svalbardensis]|uniref:Alpha/beta hydrolase n=1 Tax=Bdellovibrio svalbardensis TaxID=2972972 RepID=A0ABT6DPS2_9BACT|nr:alpha/beta hydrolase [Bdellovibrio svalbardensis]MDG0817846.1 alpha/beta hydrolase [Bdellovibrio svalbardensis]